jgi:hypothetical protein
MMCGYAGHAEIKVDAFNFNRYGLVSGKVRKVSPDAITRDKSPTKRNADNGSDVENDSSEPANQELVYAACKCRWRTGWSICRQAWR